MIYDFLLVIEDNKKTDYTNMNINILQKKNQNKNLKKNVWQ